jgi:type II secretory pathway predicted ATPase ExeA
MYLSHFGLTQPPFSITPNPEFFYAGNQRGAILDALVYAVSHVMPYARESAAVEDQGDLSG